MITEITVNDITNNHVLDGSDLVVLMFYGPTCNPCKMTMPYYDSAAQFYTNKQARIRFYRINSWEPEEQKIYVNETWKITGVPTFKIFSHNSVVAEKVGGGDHAELCKFIHEGIDATFKLFGVII
jgi:thiol-disulfide isomerase/thioredoxin